MESADRKNKLLVSCSLTQPAAMQSLAGTDSHQTQVLLSMLYPSPELFGSGLVLTEHFEFGGQGSGLEALALGQVSVTLVVAT